MNILAIKKNAKLEPSFTHSIECTVYMKHGIDWFCPDPFNKAEAMRLEIELDRGEWSGKETRWITHEQYLLWSFQQ